MIYSSLYGLVSKLAVRGGNGGNGISAIERKGKFKYKLTGGNGGKGGDVLIKAYSGVGSLGHIKPYKIYSAANGEPGQGHCRYGKKGKELELRVPIHTDIYSYDVDENQDKFTFKDFNLLKTLNKQDDLLMLSHGGRGGLGSVNMVRKNQEIAQSLLKGKEASLERYLLVYSPPIDITLCLSEALKEDVENTKEIEFFLYQQDRFSRLACSLVFAPLNQNLELILRKSKNLIFIANNDKEIEGMNLLDSIPAIRYLYFLKNKGDVVNNKKTFNKELRDQLIEKINILIDEKRYRRNCKVFREREYRTIEL